MIPALNVMPFDFKEHEKHMRLGKWIIKGMIYHDLGPDGHIQLIFNTATPLPGMKVFLFPDTKYWRRYIELVAAQEKIEHDWLTNMGKAHVMPVQRYMINAHPGHEKFRLRDTTDSLGRCSFGGLAPGKYLLFASIFNVAFSERKNVVVAYDPYAMVEYRETRNFKNDWIMRVRHEVTVTQDGQVLVEDIKAERFLWSRLFGR